MDDKLIQDKELVKQQECPVNRVHKLDKEVMSNEEGKHPKVDSNRKSPYILNGHWKDGCNQESTKNDQVGRYERAQKSSGEDTINMGGRDCCIETSHFKERLDAILDESLLEQNQKN